MEEWVGDRCEGPRTPAVWGLGQESHSELPGGMLEGTAAGGGETQGFAGADTERKIHGRQSTRGDLVLYTNTCEHTQRSGPQPADPTSSKRFSTQMLRASD